MLAARLAGVDAGLQQAELRRGTLPPGPLGLRLLDELAARSSRSRGRAAGARRRAARARRRRRPRRRPPAHRHGQRRCTATSLASTSYSRWRPSTG
jgi:hypothetical protein